MIVEFERTKGSRITVSVRRDPLPYAEVELAEAHRALHDIRLAIYHGTGTQTIDSIARDTLGASE